MKIKQQKIGLALSGGGAMGVVHMGALKQLEKNQIPIQVISGTSSGAIVGALYADGGTKKVHKFFDMINQENLFSMKNIVISRLSPTTIFEKVRSYLKKSLDAKNFEDLPIKFICVATNIITAKEKIFSEGNLVDAVMASSAYPGIFPIQKIGSDYFVDGGVIKNFPASELKRYKCNFIIGSLTYGTKKLDIDGELLLSHFDVLSRSFDIIQNKLTQKDLKKCNFVFNPPIYKNKWYHFDQMDIIEDIGIDYAKRHMPQLLKKLNNDTK